MIWLTWRQFRTQAVAVSAVLAAFAILLLVTGPHVVALARQSGFGTCHSNCGVSAGTFLNLVSADQLDKLVFTLGAALIIVLPGVIGLFWGAPLIARELESGTFRLAWNQSVTRQRWLAVKLGVLGLTGMALAGLVSLILGWWASPIDHAAGFGSVGGIPTRFFPLLFGARGIAPIGYAAFAFALGALIGLIVRRTIAAMAVTLAVFAIVQIAVPLWVRPHLITPVTNTVPLTAASIDGLGITKDGQLADVFATAPSLPGAWIYSNQVTTSSGSTALGAVPQACRALPQNGPQACFSALAQKNLKRVVVYQPASRYWTFQWIETGIYLTVAILLAWACFWWVRRRLS
jgi:ABC-type transport system involved in multi-copper enzyme maturation permease subunit